MPKPTCRACRALSVTHGFTRYSRYGCRCDICREAQRKRQSAYRDSRREREPDWNTALANTKGNKRVGRVV